MASFFQEIQKSNPNLAIVLGEMTNTYDLVLPTWRGQSLTGDRL